MIFLAILAGWLISLFIGTLVWVVTALLSFYGLILIGVIAVLAILAQIGKEVDDVSDRDL